jgi:hypothetical protein
VRTRLVVAVLLVTIAACLLGCPKRTVTVKGAEGEKATVTTEQGKQKMTVTGPKGEKTTVVTDKAAKKSTITVQGNKGESKIEVTEGVDLSKLGVKAYPGATTEGGGSYSATGDEAGAITGANLTTPDSFDKVAKFYKDNYSKGATMVNEAPNNLVITRQEKGKMITIAVSREEGAKETKIFISVVEGMH